MKWTRTGEAKPERGKVVLTWWGYGEWGAMLVDADGRWRHPNGGRAISSPTHWMEVEAPSLATVEVKQNLDKPLYREGGTDGPV